MVPLSAFCKKLMQRSSVVLPEPLLPRIETYFNEEQIVVITAMGVMMIANNYFNDILDVTPDHLA